MKRQIITHLMALAIGALLTYGKASTTTSNKQDNTVKTEVRTSRPDGTIVVRTRIRNNVRAEEVKNVRPNSPLAGVQEGAAKAFMGSDKVRIGFIASASLNNPQGLIYGGSVQRKLIGPLNIGIFGLTNATFGVILGLDL